MSEERVRLRPAVRWFAEQMELALRRNDHKSGWLDCNVNNLFAHLAEEAAELGEAMNVRIAAIVRDPGLLTVPREIRNTRVIEEAADVANMAMMVADHCGPRIGSARAPQEETPTGEEGPR